MIKQAITLFKEKGLLNLAKEGIIYGLKIVSSPYYFLTLAEQTGTPEELVDYTYKAGFGLISPLQHRSEIIGLLKEVEKRKPKTLLEIGTATGGTLYLLTRFADENATIISLDLPGGAFGGGYPSWKIPLFKSYAKPGQTIILVRADSHNANTLETIKKALNGKKIDFLFIDGDHTYEGVKKDYEMYSTLSQGPIGFHDIIEHSKESGCNVHEFWNEIKKDRERLEFIAGGQKWGGIGLLT